MSFDRAARSEKTDSLPQSQIVMAIQVSARLVLAVLLQDMRTRFGRGYISYLIAVGWPLSHALFIVGGYALLNRLAPVGDDPMIFALTGVMPYILCFYPGRTMPTIFIQNRQLLNMPIVRPIHIILSGLVIELLTGVCVLLALIGIAVIVGVDIIPSNIGTAFAALLTTLYLGIGLGTLNVVGISLLGPFYMVFYILSMIGLYITSGVYVPSWLIPEATREYLQYNPLFNLVEWFRSAYYASYDLISFNIMLVLGTATTALFLGLLGERFLRNKLFG